MRQVNLKADMHKAQKYFHRYVEGIKGKPFSISFLKLMNSINGKTQVFLLRNFPGRVYYYETEIGALKKLYKKNGIMPLSLELLEPLNAGSYKIAIGHHDAYIALYTLTTEEAMTFALEMSAFMKASFYYQRKIKRARHV